MADLEQVKTYFKRLYEPGQHFELVAIKGATARRKTFEYAEDSTSVYSAVEQFENLSFNVFASALPLEVQKQGSYDRIWVDRDDVTAPWPFGADPKWEYAAWPKPTTLVQTSSTSEGFRWQAIWKLDELVPEDEARSIIKRLAKIGIADASVHDPRRILRVPGVMNAKRQSVSKLLGSSSDVTSVASFLLPDDIATEGVTLDALMAVNVSAPHQILGEWLNGTDEGDRARKAFVTARFLKSCLVSFDDALAIVNTGAKRATPPLSDSEVIHSVRSAYNRQEN